MKLKIRNKSQNLMIPFLTVHLSSFSKKSNWFRISNFMLRIFVLTFILAGCTVKAVGDPNRPITINANVVVDVRGLKQTASSIEDQVAKGAK